MRHLLIPLALAVMVCTPALGEVCPKTADIKDVIDPLLAKIQDADNASEAKQIFARLWDVWSTAPNEQAQAILDRGLTRFKAYDFVGATTEFDRLVAYCPEYAEGYNQRAFVNYLRQDFDTALGDLDRAIALSPRHIGALSGRGLTLLGLGRKSEARKALKAALALNPWLSERGLIEKGGPLAPEGQEL